MITIKKKEVGLEEEEVAEITSWNKIKKMLLCHKKAQVKVEEEVEAEVHLAEAVQIIMEIKAIMTIIHKMMREEEVVPEGKGEEQEISITMMKDFQIENLK